MEVELSLLTKFTGEILVFLRGPCGPPHTRAFLSFRDLCAFLRRHCQSSWPVRNSRTVVLPLTPPAFTLVSYFIPLIVEGSLSLSEDLLPTQVCALLCPEQNALNSSSVLK